MSNYTKLVDYAAKDLLLHGDAAKAIKGTEVGAEFDAIATMSATKIDSGGALGTPSSGTLTNCTGLPLAGVVDSTTEALGVGSLEVGHASDTTITRVSSGTIAVEGVNILTTATGAALAGATFTGLVNLKSGANIASAATVDLTAATGNTVTITGTNAISALTMNDGQHMTLVADGALPLTYNATTCNIVGGLSYTCKAGEIVRAFKTGGVVYAIPEATEKAIYGGMKLTADATPAAATWTKAACSAAIFGNTGITFTDANDELTIISSGVYVASIETVSSDTAALRLHEAQVYVDGSGAGVDYTTFTASQIASASAFITASLSAPISLNAGQVVSLYLYTNAGTGTFTAGYTSLALHKIGR